MPEHIVYVGYKVQDLWRHGCSYRPYKILQFRKIVYLKPSYSSLGLLHSIPYNKEHNFKHETGAAP